MGEWRNWLDASGRKPENAGETRALVAGDEGSTPSSLNTLPRCPESEISGGPLVVRSRVKQKRKSKAQKRR